MLIPFRSSSVYLPGVMPKRSAPFRHRPRGFLGRRLRPLVMSGMNKCEHLVQADRHIAECKARIERQRQVIQQAEQRGQNTLWAKETLKTWEENLRVFEKHRQMIVDRLKDAERR